MNQFLYQLMILTGKLFYRLPRKLQFFIGDCIGFLWFDLFRIRRKVAIENIKIVFPNMSYQERVKLARKSVYNLGRGLIEVLMLPHITQNWIQENVVFHNQDQYEKIRKNEKGVLWLSLHLGNGDAAASVLASQGIPIAIITKRFSIRALDQFWFLVRSRHGTQFIEAKQSVFDILKALKKQQSVVFVLDQYSGPPVGLKTNFFGKETGTAQGLAVFALKTQAPVQLLYTYRSGDGKIHIVFDDIIDFEEKQTREETVLFMTEKYNRILEKTIVQYPDQWLWIHRRWKRY